jgi:hypothetical protein
MKMEVLREFLNSKKGIAFLAGVVVWVGGRLGLDLDPADVVPLVVLCGTFILGQGVADAGKGRVKYQHDMQYQDPKYLRALLDRHERANRTTINQRGPQEAG